MDNIPDPLVYEFSPRPSFEDWKLIDKGAVMTSAELHMPWLNQYVNHEVFGVWYWENLCMRIGSVTGGLLTFEDYDTVKFGVEMHAVHHKRYVHSMLFPPNGYCDKDCYHCNLYRSRLLTEFGFELSKFLGYDGVDASVFDVYANNGVDGYDGYDGYDEGDEGDEGDDGDDDAFDNYDDDAYSRGWR
jgi:hypothetical protein